MSQLRERVSYLQGLIEGLDISDSTKEGKAIRVISDVLKEMAQAIEELAEAQDDLEDYVESIDEDLSDVEEEVYGEDFVEIECPNCGELLKIETSVLDDPETEIVCPACGDAFSQDDIEWVDYEDLDGELECECEDESCSSHDDDKKAPEDKNLV